MIVTNIMNMFIGIMQAIINAFPTIDLPIDIAAYVRPVANAVGYLDTFIDIGVITLCISAILIVDNWSLIIKVTMKVWSLLPFT